MGNSVHTHFYTVNENVKIILQKTTEGQQIQPT